MEYKIITVREFIGGSYFGHYIFEDINYEQYQGWETNLAIVRDMLNGMLKGCYSCLFRATQGENNRTIIDYNDAYNLKIFSNVMKPQIAEGEKEWNLYYCPEGDGFTSDVNLSDNNINCRAILNTTIYLKEKKRVSPDMMLKFDEVYPKISRYPLCFAIKNQLRDGKTKIQSTVPEGVGGSDWKVSSDGDWKGTSRRS
jgi:hypothetical protein